MVKHLTVADLLAALSDDNKTMGSKSHVVVVMRRPGTEGEDEYPVIGVEPYDGVFCEIVLGAKLSAEGVQTSGDDVLVQE